MSRSHASGSARRTGGCTPSVTRCARGRGGVLLNQLKDNPYSVVLLDEVDKASRSMLNLFLQAFDGGWVTDGRGKRVYLCDAIVIMTSNIGSECFRKLSSPPGFYSRQVGVEQP